jgi:hypothetical protein
MTDTKEGTDYYTIRNHVIAIFKYKPVCGKPGSNRNVALNPD